MIAGFKRGPNNALLIVLLNEKIGVSFLRYSLLFDGDFRVYKGVIMIIEPVIEGFFIFQDRVELCFFIENRVSRGLDVGSEGMVLLVVILGFDAFIVRDWLFEVGTVLLESLLF